MTKNKATQSKKMVIDVDEKDNSSGTHRDTKRRGGINSRPIALTKKLTIIASTSNANDLIIT